MTKFHQAWEAAQRELDCWADAGLTAKLWVRDDDAIEVSDSLLRLHEFAANYDIRVGLAVIPGKLQLDLPEFLDHNIKQFYPMCHGWMHVDHSRGNKPGEFGPDRPLSNMIGDAQAALGLFGEHFSTVKAIFVPPFNRVTGAMVKTLPKIGFFGVSLMPNFLERKILQFGPRLAWSGLIKIPDFAEFPRVDVHLDLINWKTKTAQETNTTVSQLVLHLRARRLGLIANTPIGLLTHHLVHDERIWRALNEATEALNSHSAVEFVDVGHLADEHALKQVNDGTHASR
jgi:hypothetical protein